MLNFILPLLKNPLTRIVAEKTVGAIQHKLEKDKIIKAKEIEAAQNISVEQVKQQENSFKDEWLCCFFHNPFGLSFLCLLLRMLCKEAGRYFSLQIRCFGTLFLQ